MLTVQKNVCVCVRAFCACVREGGAFPLNASALLSVSQSSRGYSISSLRLFLFFSPDPLLFCLSRVSIFCLSVFQSHVRHTRSSHPPPHRISHSPGLYRSSSVDLILHFFYFLLSLLDFGSCSSITATVFRIYPLVVLTVSGIRSRPRWVF